MVSVSQILNTRIWTTRFAIGSRTTLKEVFKSGTSFEPYLDSYRFLSLTISLNFVMRKVRPS